MEQPKFSKAPSSMYNSYSNVPTGNVGNNLASGAPNTIRNQHSAYSTSLSHPYTYSSSFTEPQYMKYPTRSTGPTTPSGPDWNPPPSQQRDSYNNGGSNNSVFTNNSPHQPNSSNKNPSQQQQRNNNVTMSPPLHNNQWKIGSTNPAAQYGGGGSSGDSKDFTPFSPGYQLSQQRDQMVLMNFTDSSGYRFSTQQQQTNNIQSNPSVVPQHYNQPPQQCLPLQPQNSIQNYRSLINSTRGNNNTSAVENSRGGYQNDQTKVSNQSSLMNHPHYHHRMLLESNWEFNDQPKSWSQTLPQQPPPPQQQPQQFHPHQRPNLPPHPSTSAHLHTRGQRGNDVPPMSYADQHWQQQISNGGAQLHRQPPTTSSHDQDIMVHGSFGTWNPVDSDRSGPRNSNNLKSTSRYPNSVPPRRDAVKYCPNLRQNKGTGRLWEATAYEKKEKQNQVYSNNNQQQQQRRNNNNVTNNTSPSTYNTSSASNNQQSSTTKLEQKIQVIQQSSKDESGGSDQNREDEIKFESWLESANFKWETKVVSEKSSQQQKKFVTTARLEGSDSPTATGNGEGANETESRRAASKHLYNILDRSGIIDQHQIINKKELLKKSPPLESSTPPVTTATEEHSKNQKTATDEKESNKSPSDRPNNNATDTTSSNNHSSNNRNKSTKPRGHQQQGGKSKIPSLLSIVVPRPTVPHPPHFFPPLNNDYHHYGGGGHGEPSWSSPFHHWRHPGNHGFGGPHHNMDHPHHHHPHVIPPPNSANVTPFRDRSGGSTPVVPWYVYPHHHHGNHHHHHHGVGGPPHHRGGHHGPPPPGPPPLPPPNDVAMLEMMRMREMEHNWYEEQLHQESEVMCPEDIFINRMIMNQKEATRCAAGLPPPSMRSPRMSMIMPPDILPRDWNHPAPANKAKQTLDDKHVLAKHGAIYPHDDELKSVNDVVVLTEGILKALSDQFVNEDHPLPKDEDDEDEECGETNDNKTTTTTTGGADGEQTNSKPSDKSAPTCNEKTDETAGGEFGGGETNTSNDQKEETMKNTEKKTQIKILKRPKRVPKKVPDTRPRVLCGVNRVGTLAKGLLIHGDNHVEMVLLCGSIPTKQLLERVLRHFPEQMKEARADLDYVIEHEDAGFSIVAKLTFTVKVSVTLTCVSLKPKDKKSSSSVTDDKASEVTSAEVVETSSEDNKTNEDDDETVAEKKVDEVKDEDKVMDEKLNGKEEGDVGKTTEENDNNSDDKQPEVGDDVTTEFPEDMLPLECQLEALAKLRHAKWFIGRAHPQDSCVVIIRILREMQVRVPLWAPLSCWALENLIYLALSSSNEHMSPGDAFRRVFEVIAGGILLPDGPGILDPCEKIPVDVLDCCTAQQLEEITRNAQKALSLITFRGIHQVLGMAKITAHHNRHLLNVGGGRNLSSGIRSVVTKRQQQTNENTTAEEEEDDQDITSTNQITENSTQGVDSVNEEDDVESNEVEDSKPSTPRTEEKSSTDATNNNEDEEETNSNADQEENVDKSTSSITTEKSTI